MCLAAGRSCPPCSSDNTAHITRKANAAGSRSKAAFLRSSSVSQVTSKWCFSCWHKHAQGSKIPQCGKKSGCALIIKLCASHSAQQVVRRGGVAKPSWLCKRSSVCRLLHTGGVLSASRGQTTCSCSVSSKLRSAGRGGSVSPSSAPISRSTALDSSRDCCARVPLSAKSCEQASGARRILRPSGRARAWASSIATSLKDRLSQRPVRGEQ